MNRIKPFFEKFRKYLFLALIIVFFSGLCKCGPQWLSAFDYTTLLGKFGLIGDTGSNFVGKAEISVRHAFLFSLSIIPGIILALGAVSVAAYYGALDAARELLTPLLRPVLGLPGVSGLALIGSLQSSDAGAILTRELCDKKLLSYKETSIFTAFQFSSASSVTVYLTGIPAVASFLEIPLLEPLAVILCIKIFGTNLMRLYMHYFRNDDVSLVQSISSKNSVSEDTADTSAASAFINGARRAFNIGIRQMMPNIVMAYLITEMLSISGILDYIGLICSPVMHVFGLPGEALTVLITAWLSGLGGVAVAAGLFTHGALSAHDLAILTPAIFLMGGQLQYMGRILAVIGIPGRDYRLYFFISLINAFVALCVMNLLV